jgi:hypothetical protein
MIVRALGAALALASLGALSSCADPPPLARVHVTITNLHDTLGVDVQDADSASIEVIFPGTGSDAGGVRRAIYWDLTDRFEFDVQIPPGTYGPPRFQGRYFQVCGERAVELLSVEGQAAAGFAVSATGLTAAPPMTAVHLAPVCPR